MEYEGKPRRVVVATALRRVSFVESMVVCSGLMNNLVDGRGSEELGSRRLCTQAARPTRRMWMPAAARRDAGSWGVNGSGLGRS